MIVKFGIKISMLPSQHWTQKHNAVCSVHLSLKNLNQSVSAMPHLKELRVNTFRLKYPNMTLKQQQNVKK